MDAATWSEWIAFFRRHTGFNLAYYRTGIVQRRLQTWMVRKNIPDLTTLMARIANHPEWWPDLIAYLTVDVSQFFRNRPVFTFLQEHFLRPWPAGRLCRILSLGCGRGQEVYSLALLCTRTLGNVVDWRIVGMDIDPWNLHQAAQGVYTARETAQLSAAEMAAMMIPLPNGTGYRIRAELRDRVDFVRGDLFALPFQPCSADLVLCRNVLIFVEPEYHATILTSIGTIVRPGGWCVLGSVERIPETVQSIWQPVSTVHHVYQHVRG